LGTLKARLAAAEARTAQETARTERTIAKFPSFSKRLAALADDQHLP
jgi:hypothetical protein